MLRFTSIQPILPALGCSPGPAVPPVATCRGSQGSYSYPAGWNLIAGPLATVVAYTDGPLYTFRAGDEAYECAPFWTPLEPGVGYWAYFGASGKAYFAGGIPDRQPTTLTLPAGQFVMIGNPFQTAATVTGADVIYTYDPMAAQYQQVSTLMPGQGAWAFSASGGDITLTPQA